MRHKLGASDVLEEQGEKWCSCCRPLVLFPAMAAVQMQLHLHGLVAKVDNDLTRRRPESCGVPLAQGV